MSILSTSPINTRTFDMEIAAALGSFEAAVILQQLHYWTQKEGIGVIVDQAKYIYNTFEQWVKNQFTFLTKWKFRKAMDILRSLNIVKVIRHQEKRWDQTNYYSLDYDVLRKWAKSQSIEISEMRSTAPQESAEQTLKSLYNELSNIDTKTTTKKETAKTKQKIVAAPPGRPLEEEKISEQNICSPRLTASPGSLEPQSKQIEQKGLEEKTALTVDYIVNKKWEKLIPELDAAGIPINKTVIDLLKLYSKEQVESAIALVKARKRDRYIPNVAGYFVAALKQDWASKTISDVGCQMSDSESSEIRNQKSEIDNASVFRLWYDLGKELGYCSGQEMRDGDQWICLSGSWEKWADAVARGYSLEYLKKIMKRNRS